MLKRITSIVMAAFFSLSLTFAEKIILPVNAEETGRETPVDMPFEWNEKWFGGTSSFEYNHGMARVACALAEVAYVNDETDPNQNQVRNVYRKLGVQPGNMEFNYNLDYTTPGLGINQSAYSFAHKEINSAKGKSTLIFVTIRGTPFSAPEWISNVNVSDSTRDSATMHEGFFRAQDIIHKALIYYMLKNRIDPANCYFLITGHSRGAALSNLLGARLADQGYFSTENIYVYTFASPNVTQSDNARDPKYNFIWNIVNSEDIVPTVPMYKDNWKYQKYGQTKVMVSYLDQDPEKFENELFPRINNIFKQIMGRDYYPFYSGSFIPAVVTRLLVGLYPNIKDYYSSPIALRKPAEKIFYQIYPEEEPATEPGKKTKQKKSVFESVGKSLNKKTNGALDYSEFAFLDMHICSNYLSWMTALEENELFTISKSSRIVIKGAYEAAVFDNNGNVLLRIIDSIPTIGQIHRGIMAVPFPSGTVIGFPSTQEYTIVVYKDSILPTTIPVTIEHYNAAGYVSKINPEKKLYPHKGIAYKFKVGEKTVTQTRIVASKAKSKETTELVNSAKLKQQDVFRVQPEIAVDTDGLFEAGVRAGTRRIHSDVITGQSLTDLGHSISLAAGIGHEETLISRIQLDTALYGKFLWALSDIEDGNHVFNFVPELRLSLGFKPFRRASMYISGVGDFHIAGFNDQAFSEDVRNNNMGRIHFSDSVKLYPSIRFGFRF